MENSNKLFVRGDANFRVRLGKSIISAALNKIEEGHVSYWTTKVAKYRFTYMMSHLNRL